MNCIQKQQNASEFFLNKFDKFQDGIIIALLYLNNLLELFFHSEVVLKIASNFLMFERIVLSLLGFVAGVALMKYRKQVYDFTGPFGWAEQYMGSGGTATAIVLFGFASIVLSILYLFGYFQVGMPSDMQKPGTSTPTQTSVSAPTSLLSSLPILL